MFGIKKLAALALVLLLLCSHFLLLSFTLQDSPWVASVAQASQPGRAGFAFSVQQKEQPGDYVVAPNMVYIRQSSQLILRQTHIFLAVFITLIQLALIGVYSACPIQRETGSIFLVSWHLLRAPPQFA